MASPCQHDEYRQRSKRPRVCARLCQDESLDMIFMRERTEASEAECTACNNFYKLSALKPCSLGLLHQVIPHLRLGEVNAGFYVVHCNARTRLLASLTEEKLLNRRFPARSFWQTVLKEEQARIMISRLQIPSAKHHCWEACPKMEGHPPYTVLDPESRICRGSSS